jgi:hypothetical protein
LDVTAPSNSITATRRLLLSDCRMVLLKTTAAGFAALILGVLLLTMIGQYVTVQVQEVHRHDVEPHTQFLVGDMVDKSYSLQGGSAVFGFVTVTQAPSNQTGDVRFIVFDSDNYQQWNSGSQANFAYSAEKQGQINFTFTPDKSGVYHFVFDNRASLFKKYVILTVAYNEIITSRVPDTRVTYVAWVLVAAGGLVLVYGLMRKPPVSWN